MPDMVKRISQIFADQVFHVPDYQRGYSWEQRRWNDLIEDLELLPEGRTHFTGTLVLRSRNEGGRQILDQHMHAYDAYDIIDGQQRLTTVVVLLKAIHDEMCTLSIFDGLAGRLQETYLYHTDRNGQPFTKLTLNADSQEYFANNILGLQPGIGGPTIRSHERLLGAQDYFAEYLQSQREKMGESYPEWLQKLYGKVTLQLNLIVYPVDDELDAGTIFETMNDRGKPLTELEKVKNYLLYVSGKLDLPDPHDLSTRINETWKFMNEHLMAAGLAGRGNEDQLLRAHWLMIYDYDPSRWENARSVKMRFNLRKYQTRHTELLNELKEYLHSLSDSTSAYCDIYRPWHPGAFRDISDPAIREQVVLYGKKLTRLGVSASFLPLLMAVRSRAGDNGTTYLNILQLLEKFSFRVFSWRNARSNAGQTSFFQLGNRYYQNANTNWMLDEIAQLIIAYCPDETFNERFNRENENWYQWRDINYFLYEYEHYLAGGRPVQLTWEALNARHKSSSIEHILPQTPEAVYWQKCFTPEQRQRWTHDFGNLTLTYDNSGLSNKPFPDKKGAPGKKGTYADSPLFIERELAQMSDWTVDTLQARREQMIAWAKQRWKIETKPRPKNEPKSIEGVFDKAETLDIRQEMEALHSAARKLGLWPTVRKGIQYRHPNNYRLSVMVVYLYKVAFSIYFHMDNFSAFPGISPETAMEVLQMKNGWNWLTADRIPALAVRIEALAEMVKAAKPKDNPVALSSIEEQFIEKADQNGCGQEFRALLAAHRKRPMYPRMQWNWSGVKFTSMANKSEQLIWIGPDLYYSIVYQNFERFFGIPENRVKEILGEPARRNLMKDEVPDVIARLDQLFKEIEE